MPVEKDDADIIYQVAVRDRNLGNWYILSNTENIKPVEINSKYPNTFMWLTNSNGVYEVDGIKSAPPPPGRWTRQDQEDFEGQKKASPGVTVVQKNEPTDASGRN